MLDRGAAFSLLLWVAGGVACGARSSLPVGDRSDDGGGGDGAGGGGDGGGGGEGGVGGVEQLALGADHSCLRTIAGDVYCWGFNADGQLGVGDSMDSLIPRRVSLPSRAEDIAAGSYHTCAALSSGEVYCWGNNNSGQLGAGTSERYAESPELVAFGAQAGLRSQALGLGEAHSCAVMADAAGSTTLYCWGAGGVGQIGPTGTTNVPVAVQGGVRSVVAGAYHSCFDDPSGQVFCTGENGQFQCGVDDPTEVFSPVAPNFPFTIAVLGLTAGRGQHSCAWGVDGPDAIQCWGDNDSGQLGVPMFEAGTPADTQPFIVSGLTDVKAGFSHTCALAGQRVFCWGENGSGQLGDAGPSRSTPVEVPGLGGSIVAIGTGTLHTCAVRSPTEIYCWGSNDFGQLGDGTTNPASSPVRVTLP